MNFPGLPPALLTPAVDYEKLGLVGMALLVAMLLAVVLTPVAMRLAKRAGVMDHPHARRVHTHPTPRWGGLAIFAAFALTVFIMAPFHWNMDGNNLLNPRVLGILAGAVLVTALGALDDKFQVPAKLKLLGQILAASVLVLPVFGVRMVVAFDADLHPLLGALLTVLWVVAVTNTINLIDGLDGLAAGISGIAALTFVVISVTMKGTIGFAILAAALAGACLGFLRYNYHPAKVFMGDAGSHFLGFTIAALSVLQNWKVATGVAFAVPLLILAVPIFDTTFAIVRRLRRGQPIFSPDKGHLHHRLLNMGLNQQQVVVTIYLLTALGCTLALLLARARLWP
jgi:UDP-GlcNAc:undecaprenyl-phosphate GlcNAc-1-phosphate transferase